MNWEYATLVAVQTGRSRTPLRVARVNGQLWNGGHLWDTDDGAASPEEMLNRLGAEGWELVSVITAMDGWDDGSEAEPPQHKGRTFVYYVKRSRS